MTGFLQAFDIIIEDPIDDEKFLMGVFPGHRVRDLENVIAEKTGIILEHLMHNDMPCDNDKTLEEQGIWANHILVAIGEKKSEFNRSEAPLHLRVHLMNHPESEIYKIEISKNATVKDLEFEIGKMCKIAPTFIEYKNQKLNSMETLAKYDIHDGGYLDVGGTDVCFHDLEPVREIYFADVFYANLHN